MAWPAVSSIVVLDGVFVSQAVAPVALEFSGICGLRSTRRSVVKEKGQA